MPKVSRAPKFRRGAGAPALGDQPSKEKAKRVGLDSVLIGSSPSEESASAGSRQPSAGSGRGGGESDSKLASSKPTGPLSPSKPPSSPSTASPSKKPLDKKSAANPLAGRHDGDAGGLSRGQRKRQAKKDQYLRKEQLVMASLKLRRDDEQRRRIDGLDAIRSALMESAGVRAGSGSSDMGPSAPAPSALKTNLSKQRLVQREAAQMSLVLQHPAFQEDPFDAIRQHLRNTAAARTSSAGGGRGGEGSATRRKGQSERDEAKEKRVRHRKHRVKATRSKSRR